MHIIHSFLLWHNIFAFASLSDPLITPAPIPENPELRREAFPTTSFSIDTVILDDLSYCYGEGSICRQANDLYSECQEANPEPVNATNFAVCQCTNGHFAADQACNWCELGFNSSLTWDYQIDATWSTLCSSLSVTFAPVPASALAVVSAWNATYTGAIPTPGSGGGRVSSTGSGTSASTSITTSLGSTTPAGTTTSIFFGGGGGGGQTTASPLVSVSGAGQSSSTPKPNSGIRYAPRWEKILLGASLCFMAWFLS